MHLCLPIIAYNSGTFKERLSGYEFQYKIHECEYDAEKLYKDIYDFWNELRNNTYVNKYNNKHMYDIFDYSTLYSKFIQ